jgi:hypothetical protein
VEEVFSVDMALMVLGIVESRVLMLLQDKRCKLGKSVPENTVILEICHKLGPSNLVS